MASEFREALYKRNLRDPLFRDFYEDHVNEAAKFIGDILHPNGLDMTQQPAFGLTLGTGLGPVAKAIECPEVIPYDKIPHFPLTRTSGHSGNLIIGTLGEVVVIGFQGRVHYNDVAHEPNGMLNVTFPVHVLAQLGVQNYFATNAAGGMNPNYSVGDIVIIKDFISGLPSALAGRRLNFQTVNSYDPVGEFFALNEPFDSGLVELLKKAVGEHQETVHEGVYMPVVGRNFETKAEARMYRQSGVDAMGMSTVPGIITANHRGMKVVAASSISNVMADDGDNPASHAENKEALTKKEQEAKTLGTITRFFELYNEKHGADRTTIRTPAIWE